MLGTYQAAAPIWGVTVSGDYAYIAAEAAGLIVLNVSTPAAPVRVGGYNTSESAYDVFLSGDHAYVADGQSGLVVIDVSNPVQPNRVGGLDGAGEVRQVVVSGNYAFLADRYWSGTDWQSYGALRIMDISNPASPRLVGKHQTGGQAWYLAVKGDLAYVGADALEVFNVSDPANPQRVGTYGTGGAVALQGDRAFVANFQSGLHVLDLTDPVNPRSMGLAACAGYARGVAIAGRYAYVTAETYDPVAYGVGLQIFDVGPPVEEPLPPLNIALSDRKAVVTWPASIPDVTLETSESLGATPTWAPEPTAPEVIGEQRVVTLEIGGGARFFRLKKP
ncbi:MAG: hypothetical protein H7A47_03005 [Verrucomicrobiales bacterium]|nr:hypothetical protein [Verrucomicrobiales bacterium]